MTERLIINPEPLHVITVRPREVQFLVCVLSYGPARLRASVHKDYCPRAPRDGKMLKNKTTWATTSCSRTEMERRVGELEDAAIEVAVWCSTCRGWSVT